MKKHMIIFAAGLLLAGCAVKQLPSEDIEVLTKYADTIAVLKDPKLPTNGEEKYRAAKFLIKHVDMTFTRETKTLNDLLYYGDALIDDPSSPDRIITFNYQHDGHYVRMIFHTYQQFVLRVDIIDK